MQFRDGFKERAADFEILVSNLLLQGDGMAGNDAGAFSRDGVDKSGDEVGEAFTDAGAGFEEEGFAGFEGIGNRERHGVLLGSVVELEDSLQVTAFFEDGLNEGHEVTGDGGVPTVFDKTNHSFTEEQEIGALESAEGILFISSLGF